jgi:hypothetical protein
MHHVVHRSPEQLGHGVARHLRRGRVHENRAPFVIQPIDALARRLQDELVLASQRLEPASERARLEPVESIEIDATLEEAQARGCHPVRVRPLGFPRRVEGVSPWWAQTEFEELSAELSTRAAGAKKGGTRQRIVLAALAGRGRGPARRSRERTLSHVNGLARSSACHDWIALEAGRRATTLTRSQPPQPQSSEPLAVFF